MTAPWSGIGRSVGGGTRARVSVRKADDDVRAKHQVVARALLAPIARATLAAGGKAAGASLPDATVEDDLDLAIVVKTLDEVVVEPGVMPGNDEDVAGHRGS
jgi:hypothetical protein